EDLEKELARRLGAEFRRPARPPAPADLVKALPEGAVFIDLVDFLDYERASKWAVKRRYAAFVLRRGEGPRPVALGEADPSEEAWAAWGVALNAGKPDREAAQLLADRVWKPLREYLPADTRVVYLAPAGVLGEVPWAALPGAKPGTVLLEDHA